MFAIQEESFPEWDSLAQSLPLGPYMDIPPGKYLVLAAHLTTLSTTGGSTKAFVSPHSEVDTHWKGANRYEGRKVPEAICALA